MNIGRKLWQIAAMYAALPVIRRYARKYGTLTRFYDREVELANKSDKKCVEEVIRNWIDTRQIADMLAIYELESDSYGYSPLLKFLNDATHFGLLSPLKFTEDEFMSISDGTMQNNRRASVFLEEDGTLRDIDAFELDVEYTFDCQTGKLDDEEVIRKSSSPVFFYDEKHDNWWVASSSAVFKNTSKYMGDTFRIPVMHALNNEDYYFLALESMVPDEFKKRFRFVNALNDALITGSEKTMISEDFAYIVNKHLEKQLMLAFHGCEYEDDEPEQTGRFEDNVFIMDDMVDDAVVRKLVTKLIDDGIPEEFIHVSLGNSNMCETLKVDCTEGTMFDIIKSALDELGIREI